MQKYDLEDRTEEFSVQIINFCKELNKKPMSKPLVNQLLRAATSVGANYREANGASSKKDFKNKIHICKKEAKETCYWLRIISRTDSNLREKARPLEGEARQFVLIFSKIVPSSS